MKKWNGFAGIFVWMSLILLTLASCDANQAENAVLEEIRSAPAVKLESAEQQDSNPVFVDNAGTTASVADMRIQPSAEAFNEEWRYRFTYNPQEKVIDGHEITVLFGLTSMEIDGITYVPEDGVEYDTILQWAQGAYDSYAQP